MPKLEPKQIQKELEKGLLWPVYWLYGQESMKSRELLKRIRRVVLGTGDEEQTAAANSFAMLSQETLDGSETHAQAVVDAAQSMSLGGGIRLVIVRDAHAIKESEQLSSLLGPAQARDQIPFVCVFISKDLDGRKKFSKLLLDQAAVVPCEEVSDEDRESWIQYLAKRKGLELSAGVVIGLRALDPWTLDIVDRELEKLALSDDAEIIVGGVRTVGEIEINGSEAFLDAFLKKDLKNALSQVSLLADSPEESLPLLGLLGWNARYLGLILADRAHGTRTVRLSPFLAERMNRWASKWSLAEALELQGALAKLDFGFKQTQRIPLGLWTQLVTTFC